ncbi:hypothetical protein KW850_03120 [Bacillus sp. sid0103]|uniref:hypothetical protein n=1 Tax=Bacillus sp. sid0103 TaxID=2856337 RepID=UPI001C437866|nr:hypothetical protein [Bacillus sp. sid0103]MBV7504256.1 hypothetical protein [Bacillus sp. sid0103]
MHALDLKKSPSDYQVECIVHLPDKGFVDFCSEKYSINRGVFNVIDHWFFVYGLENIVLRRKAIVQFLTYLYSENSYTHKKMYLQFWKGGVKKSLYYFVDECLNKQKSI